MGRTWGEGREVNEEPVRLDGFCGLYCGACEVLRAVEDGKVAEAARMFGGDPSEIHCAGCRSNDVFVNCRGCGIRDCASKRGFRFCSECVEFPCGEYRGIASLGDRIPPHFKVTMRNLAEVREKGIEEWRRLQVERWACPSCGAPFSWYATSCACGQDLDGIKDWQTMSDADKAWAGSK